MLTLPFSYLKFMKVYRQWVPFECNFLCIIWEYACAFNETPILISSTWNKHNVFLVCVWVRWWGRGWELYWGEAGATSTSLKFNLYSFLAYHTQTVKTLTSPYLYSLIGGFLFYQQILQYTMFLVSTYFICVNTDTIHINKNIYIMGFRKIPCFYEWLERLSSDRVDAAPILCVHIWFTTWETILYLP